MNNPYSPFLALILGIGFFMLIVKLFKSKSEGARRTRIVLGITAGLFVVGAIVTGFSPLEAAILTAIIGAAWWIIKGFSKP
jgi:MFS superfamily sulfate permease-like transporter